MLYKMKKYKLITISIFTILVASCKKDGGLASPFRKDWQCNIIATTSYMGHTSSATSQMTLHNLTEPEMQEAVKQALATVPNASGNGYSIHETINCN